MHPPLTAKGLEDIMDEHARCVDPVYYFQRHVTGKPVSVESRRLIRRWEQMNRVILSLKVKQKVSLILTPNTDGK